MDNKFLILKFLLMKKVIFVLLVLFFTPGLFAQNSTDENQKNELIERKEYVYCQIMGREKLLSAKVTVDIDFGQEVSFWKQDRRYKDENGKAVTFNSMVDAMNFMGSLGWEFVQAYVVTVGQQNVYHWLLKMEKDSDFVEP